MNININKSFRDAIIAIAVLVAFALTGWFVIKYEETKPKPSCPHTITLTPETKVPTFEGLGG